MQRTTSVSAHPEILPYVLTSLFHFFVHDDCGDMSDWLQPGFLPFTLSVLKNRNLCLDDIEISF